MNIEQKDRIFSKYIRQRVAHDGYLHCFICLKNLHWKEADCAHYIGRENMSLRYDPINCQATCRECNRFDEDHRRHFRTALINEYGTDEIERLETTLY